MLNSADRLLNEACCIKVRVVLADQGVYKVVTQLKLACWTSQIVLIGII